MACDSRSPLRRSNVVLENGQVKEASDEVVFGLMAKGMDALAGMRPGRRGRGRTARFSDAAVQYDKLTLGGFRWGRDERRRTGDDLFVLGCRMPGAPGRGRPHSASALVGTCRLDWRLMLDVISRYKIVGGTGLLVDGLITDITGDIRTAWRLARSSRARTVSVSSCRTERRSRRARSSALSPSTSWPPSTSIRCVRSSTRWPARGRFPAARRSFSASRENRRRHAVRPRGPFVWVQYNHRVGDDHIAVAFGSSRHGTAVDECRAGGIRGSLRDLEVCGRVHDWTADPLSRARGQYLPQPPAARPGALEAPDGRVLLAGRALASGSFGLIDGAIQTGTRARRDAVLLRPA